MEKKQFIQRIINRRPTVNLQSKHWDINSPCFGESAVGFEDYDDNQMKEFENELRTAIHNSFNKDAFVRLEKHRGYEDDWVETPPPYRLHYYIRWKMTNNEVIIEENDRLYGEYNKQRIELDQISARKNELEVSMDDLYKRMNELRSKIV